jgi:hypothetical protein
MKIHFIAVYFDFGVLAIFKTNCKKNYVIPLCPHNRGRHSPGKIKQNQSSLQAPWHILDTQVALKQRF